VLRWNSQFIVNGFPALPYYLPLFASGFFIQAVQRFILYILRASKLPALDRAMTQSGEYKG